MKLIFAGTPDIAAHVLKALAASEHNIIAVYTQPDRPKGRGKKISPSPVKSYAQEQGLVIEQPEHFKDPTTIETFCSYQADALIVIAYGLILPTTILNANRFGGINIHVSLLPRWRGAAPIQSALLANDQQTGISIMQMDQGMDTGPIYYQLPYTILPHDNAASLSNTLVDLAPQALLTVLKQLEQGTAKTTTQESHLATYAPKIKKQDARMDWHQPAQQLACQIRAYNPWPVAFTPLDAQDNLRIWEAKAVSTENKQPPGTILVANQQQLIIQTKKDGLSLQKAQLSGKSTMLIGKLMERFHHRFKVGEHI
jgi:methionyl-tRNA formyltransferase